MMKEKGKKRNFVIAKENIGAKQRKGTLECEKLTKQRGKGRKKLGGW